MHSLHISRKSWSRYARSGRSGKLAGRCLTLPLQEAIDSIIGWLVEKIEHDEIHAPDQSNLSFGMRD